MLAIFAATGILASCAATPDSHDYNLTQKASEIYFACTSHLENVTVINGEIWIWSQPGKQKKAQKCAGDVTPAFQLSTQ